MTLTAVHVLVMSNTNYFITFAPGHYGDVATVLSSHATLAAAQRAARSWRGGVVVRKGALAKGDRWTRSSESIYPAVSR